MATNEEMRAQYDQQRELLQERREKIFALVQDLDMTEASAVLTSAMNEYLMPSPLVARFVLRRSGDRE